MEIEVGKAPTVDRSRDGRLYDNRNPNTLIQNGQARAAEVTNFIEKLLSGGRRELMEEKA